MPRYVSPKERAENRARWIRFAYWVAVAVPATIALIMFGYSDQAPGWLREVTPPSTRCSAFRCCG